ncbi:hypothetical protein VQ02_33610 [Methylobacterium variabile]|uniref:Uncharacterized protein n=1 Tax=Methylobacterium variabile TaxID=298794 RepID=A0A0J6S0R0_9HYPH|nr:hypothetical protein VQ02_33610 [Methylobacterium variabile]
MTSMLWPCLKIGAVRWNGSIAAKSPSGAIEPGGTSAWTVMPATVSHSARSGLCGASVITDSPQVCD